MSARLAVMLCALVLAPAGSARAQTPKAKARALTRTALSYYEAGEYERAIAGFAQAYSLSHAPLLLYDIAQAHRLHGDCAEALRYYGDYLRQDPNAPNRSSVEAKMAALGTCAAESMITAPPVTVEAKPTTRDEPARPPPSKSPLVPAAASAPPAAASAPPATSAATPSVASITRPRPRDRVRLIAGLTVGAAGLALAAAGVSFSVQAADASNQMARFFADGGRWDDHWRAIETNGRNATVTSAVLYSVGGALTIAGVTVLTVDRRHRGREQRPALLPSTTGVTATWTRDW